MKGRTMRSAFAGPVKQSLESRLTNAATRYSGKCVDVKNRSAWEANKKIIQTILFDGFVLEIKGKLRRLGLTNRIRPSNLKSDNKIEPQSLFDSKSDVEIGLRLNVYINF